MKKIILAGLILISGSDYCALNILPKGGLPRISGKKAVAGMLATVILGGGGALELAMKKSGTFKKAENALLKEYILRQIHDNKVDIAALLEEAPGGYREIIQLSTDSKNDWEYNVYTNHNRKELLLEVEDHEKLVLLKPYIINQPKRIDLMQEQAADKSGNQVLFDGNTLHPYTYAQVSAKNIMLGNKVKQDSEHITIKRLAFDAIFDPTYPQSESGGEVKYISPKGATNIVERNKQMLLGSGDAPIIVLFDDSLNERERLDINFGLKESIEASEVKSYKGKNRWGIALMSIRKNMRDFYKQSWFKRRLNMISKVLFNT